MDFLCIWVYRAVLLCIVQSVLSPSTILLVKPRHELQEKRSSTFSHNPKACVPLLCILALRGPSRSLYPLGKGSLLLLPHLPPMSTYKTPLYRLLLLFFYTTKPTLPTPFPSRSSRSGPRGQSPPAARGGGSDRATPPRPSESTPCSWYAGQ